MQGTAKTEENEFISTYNLPVVEIPTNKPVIRKDLEDKLYKTENAKYLAVLKTIESVHLTGQPILVGTASIEKSEILSYLLNKKGLKHQLLNAKNDYFAFIFSDRYIYHLSMFLTLVSYLASSYLPDKDFYPEE